MKIRSVSHIGLTVSNFEKSVSWYHKYFGFLLIDEQTLDSETVKSLFPLYELEDNSVRLGFLRAPKGQVIEIFEFKNQLESSHPLWHKPGPTHFTLDVRNVPKWFNTYKDELNFLIEPQETAGSQWIFLKDPDGNLVELMDLKLNYFIIMWLGGIAGKVMKATKFKEYYKDIK
ncbi:MAG: VOC family protein [Spirochaetaceae bacterium]